MGTNTVHLATFHSRDFTKWEFVKWCRGIGAFFRSIYGSRSCQTFLHEKVALASLKPFRHIIFLVKTRFSLKFWWWPIYIKTQLLKHPPETYTYRIFWRILGNFQKWKGGMIFFFAYSDVILVVWRTICVKFQKYVMLYFWNGMSWFQKDYHDEVKQRFSAV